MQEHPAPRSFIPLELATAFLNLGEYDDARRLLELFLQYHPDVLPAYQFLCEIFWETKAFDQAEARLSTLPLELAESDPELMTRYLTDYSVTHGEQLVDRWKALANHLLTKYNDGYVKDENGRPQERGYPESWLHKVVRARPDQFRLPGVDTTVSESSLTD